MKDEERQKRLVEMARRTPDQELADQKRGGSGGQVARGCLFFAIAIPIVLVFIHFFVTPLVKPIGAPEPETDRALAEMRRGPIPRRFQGAYNTIRCGGGGQDIDGLITVSGKQVSFTSVDFNATALVSQSDRSVTVRGTPSGVGFKEPERNYTITLSEDGSTADLDGVRAYRCSHY